MRNLVIGGALAVSAVLGLSGCESTTAQEEEAEAVLNAEELAVSAVENAAQAVDAAANESAGPMPDVNALLAAHPAPPPTFRGYACTHDCSGHDAGYQWAEDNDIKDPDECGGNSNSFIEGCEAFAEEARETAEAEREAEEEY